MINSEPISPVHYKDNDNESCATSSNRPVTFLIEIAGATLPSRKPASFPFLPNSKPGSNGSDLRGIHCTAHWVDLTSYESHHNNESHNLPSEVLLHRTKTLRLDGAMATPAAHDDSYNNNNNNNGMTEDYEQKNQQQQQQQQQWSAEHFFSMTDSSLFLFHTTMKQLVLAASGGIRFDLFEKPTDAFSNIFRHVLAKSISEKEQAAFDGSFRSHCRGTSTASVNSATAASLMGSYHLVGSVFLTPKQILERCHEKRFECDLLDGLRRQQQLKQQQKLLNQNNENNDNNSQLHHQNHIPKVNGGKLALRIRKASEFDVVFLQTLESCESNGVEISFPMIHNAFYQHQQQQQYQPLDSGSSNIDNKIFSNNNSSTSTCTLLQPAQLITEIDENVVTAQASLKSLGNIAPMAQESMRYLLSNDSERRILVKPYPDPDRVNQTTWLSEGDLQRECWKPSTNWIKAGSCTNTGSRRTAMGKMYIEVIQCRKLINVDMGPGNKTDAFISIVYGDVMVQTDVIDDSLSPVWLPWTRRAFIFPINHPSTAVYLGVIDYDIGPLEHQCLGRVAIHLSRFSPGVLYTLSYKLYESSSLTERGSEAGIITLRLRLEYDERIYLMEGWRAPKAQWVNSQQYKTHKAAKFCCDGPHDEEVFEMRLFRSHINEILTAKRTLTYIVSDAVHSIVFWRGQVKVGNAWLPLHSAVVFYFSACLIERPHLLPSFFFFACGWIMIANMFLRQNHPNPWHRGHSFVYYWNILVHGKSLHTPKEILTFEGQKETLLYEKFWQDRLHEDDALVAKQAERDAKVQNISNDTVIQTKAKKSAATPLVDPIAAVAGARLLPYQQYLGRYCEKIRYIRNVINWSESVMAFWLTFGFFGCGVVALMIPWAFVLRWTSRFLVWIFLGPWMKVVDVYLHGHTAEEEWNRLKAKTSNNLLLTFQQQYQEAKILREDALKLKAFRVRLFGQYITRLPKYNLARHEDLPLEESTAEPYERREGDDNEDNNEIKTKLFVPGQNLSGVMIPITGDYNVRSPRDIQKEKEDLINQYMVLLGENRGSKNEVVRQTPEENVFDEIKPIIFNDSSMRPLGVEDNSSNKINNINSESDNHITESRMNRLSSRSDIFLSERAIQKALDTNQVVKKEPKPKSSSQSQWVFSASIHLCLKKKSTEDTAVINCLDHSTIEKNRIQCQRNCAIPEEIEEEGIEIVLPALLTEERAFNKEEKQPTLEGCHPSINNRHVSVLYVKDKDKSLNDLD